ncbi:hypothetical protein COY28_01730 [Candidatus Woesearchaeota archaeon CG_4_10_14_0_2_um_filter_57_5]|nr:MAG: hypothetical protein AUJ68_02245 [Candidatus Woesearchaeota archaeon CG1_02_57_44]PIZ55602.1 MAG: hypothetical protein COY28_01730 [Candidatus Woesearchaeota archaeon CG_4_10_14_0_2_um_filter_57_5]
MSPRSNTQRPAREVPLKRSGKRYRGVYKAVLGMAKVNAKSRRGGLFIIAPQAALAGKYRMLYTRILPEIKVMDAGAAAVIEHLSTLDGAIIVSDTGTLLAYGAMVRKTKALRGFGTKHAAAAGVTSGCKGSTAILVPEHEDWIKIFQDGHIVLEMDSAAQPKSVEDKVVSFLADRDTALLTAAGASAAILGIGPALVIGGTYLAIRTATGLIKRNIAK